MYSYYLNLFMNNKIYVYRNIYIFILYLYLFSLNYLLNMYFNNNTLSVN